MRWRPLGTQCSLYSISPTFRPPTRPKFCAYIPLWPVPSSNLPHSLRLRIPFRWPTERLMRAFGHQRDRPGDIPEEGFVAVLAEGADDFVLGPFPQGVRFPERPLSFRGDPHQAHPPVLARPHQRIPASSSRARPAVIGTL